MSAVQTMRAASDAIYPSLAARHVVITGGASGIGAAMVAAFARQGARAALIDIDDAAGAALLARLADSAYLPRYHHCDLSDTAALAARFARIASEGGPVEILINNAANDERHDIDAISPAEWDARMAVNLRHQFFCAQAVVPGMRALGGGVILNLGSISWHLALPRLALYMTAKAAIEGLTRGLARDLGADGIRVNCIIPGAVRTPRQQRWHTPADEAAIVAAQCLHQRVEVDDVAALALFLASDNARRCTGRDYYVDAGWYGA